MMMKMRIVAPRGFAALRHRRPWARARLVVMVTRPGGVGTRSASSAVCGLLWHASHGTRKRVRKTAEEFPCMQRLTCEPRAGDDMRDSCLVILALDACDSARSLALLRGLSRISSTNCACILRFPEQPIACRGLLQMGHASHGARKRTRKTADSPCNASLASRDRDLRADLRQLGRGSGRVSPSRIPAMSRCCDAERNPDPCLHRSIRLSSLMQCFAKVFTCTEDIDRLPQRETASRNH